MSLLIAPVIIKWTKFSPMYRGNAEFFRRHTIAYGLDPLANASLLEAWVITIILVWIGH